MNKDAVVYKQELPQDSDFNSEHVQNAFGELINNKKQKGVKGIVSLFVVFCKADRKEVKTNPPICLKSEPFTILEATDVEEALRTATDQINDSLEKFIRNGSGWVLDHLLHVE
eukprot:TCONS_00031064-protein